MTMFFFYLIVVISILVFFGLIYLAYNLANDGFDSPVSLLKNLVHFGIVFYLVLQVIFLIIAYNEMAGNGFVVVNITKTVISIVFFIYIYLAAKTLLENLESNTIFNKENVDSVKDMGLLFIYLSITEIAFGFLFGLLTYESSQHFVIESNNVLYVYIILGLVLNVVSLILKRAVEIYEENQLTI